MHPAHLRNNFDNIPKGTGILFCNKKLFLLSQPKESSKNSSDDITIFHNMVNKRKILKSKEIQVIYNSRNSLIKHIHHSYNRGPKFVDYYFKPGRKYFPHIFGLLIIFFSLIFLVFINPFILIIPIITVCLVLTINFIKISENTKDFFILSYLLPITLITFSLGILKGVLLKFLKKY